MRKTGTAEKMINYVILIHIQRFEISYFNLIKMYVCLNENYVEVTHLLITSE